MIKKLLFIAALVPLCMLIDLLTQSDWTASYLLFLKQYWDVILVVLVSISLFKKNKAYEYQMAASIRESQFFDEVSRYNGTPYVAPLMLLYLKNPPGSTFPTDYAYVNDTFYRTVVNAFRDRVYIMQEITYMEPAARGSYLLDIVGPKKLGMLFFYIIAPFIWCSIVVNSLDLSLLNDWPVLTIPLICISFQRAVGIVKAILAYLPGKSDEILKENECNILATWRDAFPDREIGITFVRAYYFELEKRQRYEMVLQGKTVPKQYPKWTNGNFAPFLYPSENMPVWEQDYEPYYELKRQEALALEMNTKSVKNIVNFPNKSM